MLRHSLSCMPASNAHTFGVGMLLIFMYSCLFMHLLTCHLPDTQQYASRLTRYANSLFNCFEVEYFTFCMTINKRFIVSAGRSLLLISVAKKLFSHIWEVVKDAPSFLIEYSIILRQLLTVKEYRYQMKPRTYSSEFPCQISYLFIPLTLLFLYYSYIFSGFVVLYMKKVATGFDEKISNQASSKEESFRCTLTLHVLLENPPGDYPDIMREEVLCGFCAICSNIRHVLFAHVLLTLLLNPLPPKKNGLHFYIFFVSRCFSELQLK